MVNLKNISKIKFQLDEKGKLRAQIGLSIGMIPMFLAAFVAIVILSQLQLWYKVAAGVGLGCALIMQIGGAIGSIARYKAYKAAMAEFEKLNSGAGGAGSNGVEINNVSAEGPAGYVG